LQAAKQGEGLQVLGPYLDVAIVEVVELKPVVRRCVLLGRALVERYGDGS